MSRADETVTSGIGCLPSGSVLLTTYGDPCPAGPPIVMVHGFRGDHHGLEKIALFTLRNRPGDSIVVPDLPGFGTSPRRAGSHDVAGYVAFLEELLVRLGVDASHPTVLVGHSFGSILAAHVCARRPELVRGLVLVNPIASPALSGPQALASRLTQAFYRLGAALPERAGSALLTAPAIVRVMSEVMATSRDRAMRAWVHEQHRRYFSAFADRGVVLEAFEASIAHTVREVESQLSCPVLVVAGDADAIAPLPATRAFVAALPDARLVVAPGVGHLIHYERPDLAGAALAEFIANLP